MTTRMMHHGTAGRLPEPVVDLLDGDTATRLLNEAGLVVDRAHPDYLRHKPDETSIVSYRFDVPGDQTPGLGYAQWCARAERADEIHTKALTLRPRTSTVGVSVVRIDDHTVFYGFPNDARLRRLRWYTTARKLKPALTALTPPGETISKTDSSSLVLKYKPERRVVTKVELVTTEGSRQRLLVRYTTGHHAHRLAATASALEQHGVATPAPRAQLDGGRVGIDEFVAGAELRSWVRDGGTIAEHLGRSLHDFHRTPAPRGTPHRTELDDLVNAVEGLGTLASWIPDLEGLAAGIADRLRSGMPCSLGRRTLIHGDLHDKNILIDGSRAWFIDLERAAVGSPVSDLGRLRAHAMSLGIRQPGWSPEARSHAEAVIESYRRTQTATGPTGPALVPTAADRELSWHTVIALIDQALLVTRHVEPGWPVHAHDLLSAAEAELRASSRPSCSTRAGNRIINRITNRTVNRSHPFESGEQP